MNYKKVAVATAIASAANVVIYLIGSAAGATWEVGMPTTVGLPMVIGATVVPMLLGGYALKLASKWKQSLVGLASWLGLAFAVVGAPGGYISSHSLATGIALGTMHLVVGFAWFRAVRSTK